MRVARERGLPAPDLTGEMLDEAARAVEEEPPHIDTETLQKYLDPVRFIETHSNLGGPAPAGARRRLKNAAGCWPKLNNDRRTAPPGSRKATGGWPRRSTRSSSRPAEHNAGPRRPEPGLFTNALRLTCRLRWIRLQATTTNRIYTTQHSRNRAG